MAIPTSTDYTGRLVDVNICYQFYPSVTPQKLNFQFGQVSSYIAGVQKLVQRYVIALLTNIGSQFNYPDFGTNLISSIQKGTFVKGEDIKHIFNFANYEVLTAFKSYQKENPTLPTDEMLNAAILVSYTIDKPSASVSLKIQLLTVAGDNVTVLLPVPIVT